MKKLPKNPENKPVTAAVDQRMKAAIRDLQSKSADSEAQAFGIPGGRYRPGQELTPIPMQESPERPTDRILRGIKFRTINGEALVAQRIYMEIESAVCQEYTRLERQRDENSKALSVEIELLKNALELEQARHRADVFNFASGRNPQHDVVGLAGERRY